MSIERIDKKRVYPVWKCVAVNCFFKSPEGEGGGGDPLVTEKLVASVDTFPHKKNTCSLIVCIFNKYRMHLLGNL